MKSKILTLILIVLIIALAVVASILGIKAKNNKNELNELNSKIEELTQKVEQKENTLEEVKTIVNEGQEEINSQTQGNEPKVTVYANEAQDVTIALVEYDRKSLSKRSPEVTQKYMIITEDWAQALDYRVGSYYETDGTYRMHLQNDVNELIIKDIENIEIEKSTNGGVNVLFKLDEAAGTLTIGNTTLKKI